MPDLSKSVKKQIESLRDELRHHDHCYYVTAEPEIQDREYDKLFDRLKDLEEKHPEYISPDSPTQRVSGEPLEGFQTVTHRKPMLSIDNTYSADEIRQFDQRVRKLLPDEDIEYVVEPKIDGVAMSIRYEIGQLALAATRGNGTQGDNVTLNSRTFRSLPLTLRSETAVPDVLEVRGEAFIPVKAFDQLNESRQIDGEELFANPRNTAAGSLKMLDSQIVAQRKLHFLAYALGEVIPSDFADSHATCLEKLKSLSMPVNTHYEKVPNIDAVIEVCNRWESKKHDLPFQIDGMVIKVDSYDQQQRLGEKSRAPRWCIAYKFVADQAETVIQSIAVQVGKSGALTPVANLEPVHLAGTTVSRATLHNFEELERKDIREGDTVLVEKAGEIIPRVIEVVNGRRQKESKPFVIPDVCPDCGRPVVKEEGAVAIRCVNPDCPAQIVGQLRHFVGRNQMDIEGLGKELVEQLVTSGLTRSFSDLYRLTHDKLSGLERMGEKSTDNLINAIEESKKQPLERVLAALGIMHVGTKAARVLAAEFKSIHKLMETSAEELEQMDEIGPVIAQSVYDFFHEEKTREIIHELLNLGLEMSGPVASETISTALAGKTIVVTGSIAGYGRKDMEDLIQTHGGKASGSVSKNTDLVVAGEKPGSKVEKAKKLGVDVINADEFLKMIG
jgi:DNA ligase (NAD+)